jgi:hypothetical protein
LTGRPVVHVARRDAAAHSDAHACHQLFYFRFRIVLAHRPISDEDSTFDETFA